MVPRTRTVGACSAKVADVDSSKTKPAAPKARRVILSIVILPTCRRSMNAGHRMNNRQSCLFQPLPLSFPMAFFPYVDRNAYTGLTASRLLQAAWRVVHHQICLRGLIVNFKNQKYQDFTMGHGGARVS